MNFKFATVGSLVAALAFGGNAPPTERAELTPDNRIVTILVDGRETRVEVAPDGSGSPIVNASVAEDLGFKGSMVKGVHMVGPTKVMAQSNLGRVDFGDGEAKKRRVFWFERDWSDISEGRIGPVALPHGIVSYRLGEKEPGEREIALPMEMHERRGAYTMLEIDEVEVPVRFSFDRDETMLAASTGAALAGAFDGAMNSESYLLPIEMGISRPVRPMTFGKPVMLGDLPLREIVVRSQDTGSVGSIPDADLERDRDPNEIVVTGKRRKKARHFVYVGLASLAGCSSLTFDKPAKLIRLSCLPSSQS